METGSDVKPLKQSLIDLSVRKERSQWVSSRGKPRDWKVWTSQLWLILSKKPWILNRRDAQTKPLSHAMAMSCTSIRLVSVVELASQPPNWLVGMRAYWIMS
jgi:hypothetical protein